MHDLVKLISTFVDAVAIIMALILVLSILHRNDKRGTGHSVLMGAMFSLAVIFSMSDPIPMGTGGGFDMRGLLIGTGIALLGPIVGLMAAVTALIYRFGIGGAGLYSGITLIAGAFVGGLIWRYTIKPIDMVEWKKSVILGLFISAQSAGIIFAPPHLWGVIVTELIPYIVISNVIGAVIISHLLSGELSFLSSAEASRVEASTDHLTGLLNRRGLDLAYPDLYAKALKQRGQAFLYFDIDKFKVTNDNFGHAVGDEVLQHVVELISANLRQQDVFVRLGGDEFAIILADITEDEGRAISERCRSVVADAGFEMENDVLQVTISVGGIWTRHPVSMERLIRTADQALYEAKSRGRNAVVYFAQHGDQMAKAMLPSLDPAA